MGAFADLLAQPGVVEEVALSSTFGLMAFHGGSLEEGTDTIAADVAARADASLYTVALPADLKWHVPSRLVDPDHSHRLRTFLEHVDVAVALHGYGRVGQWTTLLLGGTNRTLASHLAVHLRASLPHYEIVADLVAIPAELRGQHPDNPVNRPRNGGVQLELCPRVRGLGPYANPPDTTALVDALTVAATAWSI